MGSHTEMIPEVVLIDRHQFEQLLRVKKSAFFHWKKTDPNFPKPIVFPGGRTIRWRLTDVAKYLGSLEQASNDAAAVGGA